MSCRLQFRKKLYLGQILQTRMCLPHLILTSPFLRHVHSNQDFWANVYLLSRKEPSISKPVILLWALFEIFVGFQEKNLTKFEKKTTLTLTKFNQRSHPWPHLNLFLFWKEVIQKLFLENNFLLQHVYTFKLPFEIPYIL